MAGWSEGPRNQARCLKKWRGLLRKRAESWELKTMEILYAVLVGARMLEDLWWPPSLNSTVLLRTARTWPFPHGIERQLRARAGPWGRIKRIVMGPGRAPGRWGCAPPLLGLGLAVRAGERSGLCGITSMCLCCTEDEAIQVSPVSSPRP